MDRRQNNGSVKAVSPRIAQQLVHCAIAVSTAVFGQSHKDNVRCTAVEQQLEAKEVQLLQPSSTSLLMISPGTLTLLAQLSSFNTLDNWGHKTPTLPPPPKKKKKKKGQERKGGRHSSGAV